MAGETTPGWAELLRGVRRRGVAQVQVWLEPNTIAGIEAFAPVIEELDRS